MTIRSKSQIAKLGMTTLPSENALVVISKTVRAYVMETAHIINPLLAHILTVPGSVRTRLFCVTRLLLGDQVNVLFGGFQCSCRKMV